MTRLLLVSLITILIGFAAACGAIGPQPAAGTAEREPASGGTVDDGQVEAEPDRRLVWVDRTGQELWPTEEWCVVPSSRLAELEDRLGGKFEQLLPVWSPDGTHVSFRIECDDELRARLESML